MKENKIPSAEEFLKSKGYAKPSIIVVSGNDVIKLMIEFTKLHVKEALKYASEKAYTDTFSKNKNYRWVKMLEEFEFDPTNFEHKYVVNKKSILSAYPEELIK